MTISARVMSSIALVAAMVLLGACGAAKAEVSSKSKSLASDAATAALDTPITIGDEATTTTLGDTPSTSTSTTPPATTEREPSTTAPATPRTGRNDDAFCAAAANVADSGLDRVMDFDLTNSDSQQILAQLKEYVRGLDDSITAMDQTAPPEIDSDMHILATELSSLFQSIESGQSFGALFDSMTTMDAAQTSKAGKRVGSYLQEHCGFTLEGHAIN